MKQNRKELLTYGTLFGSLVSSASSLFLYMYQLNPTSLPVGDFGNPIIPHLLMALISFGLSYALVSIIQEPSDKKEVEI